MRKIVEKMTLSDADFELLMLHADGELAADRRSDAHTLLAESAAARAIWQDLQLSREIVKLVAEGGVKSARTDFSLVPGQIMRKLPDDEALHPVAEVPQDRGLIAWIRGLGFGKVGLVMGCAAAAVALMVARSGSLVQPPTPGAESEIAAVPGTNAPDREVEPMVIIEETDIESGTLMVHPPAEPGDSTVIWHFPDENAKPATGGEG